MWVKSRIALAILIGTISSPVLPVAAWSETATPVATEQKAHSPQFSRTVYDGYRASRLL